MRKKLIEMDLVECVIGIGKNLFYNSPMEACIVICRSQKSEDRKKKILFINAKNEVTRKNSQSYLEDSHIERISKTYFDFASIPNFSNVASIDEISDESHNYSLGISKYVTGTIDTPPTREQIDIELTRWISSSAEMHDEYRKLNDMLSGGENNA